MEVLTEREARAVTLMEEAPEVARLAFLSVPFRVILEAPVAVALRVPVWRLSILQVEAPEVLSVVSVVSWL